LAACIAAIAAGCGGDPIPDRVTGGIDGGGTIDGHGYVMELPAHWRRAVMIEVNAAGLAGAGMLSNPEFAVATPDERHPRATMLVVYLEPTPEGLDTRKLFDLGVRQLDQGSLRKATSRSRVRRLRIGGEEALARDYRSVGPFGLSRRRSRLAHRFVVVVRGRRGYVFHIIAQARHRTEAFGDVRDMFESWRWT
jgi:hypothetical protein